MYKLYPMLKIVNFVLLMECFVLKKTANLHNTNVHAVYSFVYNLTNYDIRSLWIDKCLHAV